MLVNVIYEHGIEFRNSWTYLAVIPNELYSMAWIYFAGAEITRFDAHVLLKS